MPRRRWRRPRMASSASHFGSATSPTQGSRLRPRDDPLPDHAGICVNVSPCRSCRRWPTTRASPASTTTACCGTNLIESVPLIGMTAAYTLNATGAGQAVAVLDTGVKSDHEFLIGKVVAEACFSNAFPSRQPGQPVPQRNAIANRRGRRQCRHLRLHQRLRPISASTAATLPASPQASTPTSKAASRRTEWPRDAKIFAIQIFTRFNCCCGMLARPGAVRWRPGSPTRCIALDHVFANINLGGGTVVASVNMSLGGGLFSGTCDGALAEAGNRQPARSGGVDRHRLRQRRLQDPNQLAGVHLDGGRGRVHDQRMPFRSFSNMSSVVDLLAPGASIPSSILSSVGAPATPPPMLNFQRHLDGRPACGGRDCGHPLGLSECDRRRHRECAQEHRHAGHRHPLRRHADQAAHPRRSRRAEPGSGTAPVVTQNPSNLTVTAGQQATFTAAATGAPTPTVIWQLSFDGGAVYHDIAWATSTTLTFTTDCLAQRLSVPRQVHQFDRHRNHHGRHADGHSGPTGRHAEPRRT